MKKLCWLLTLLVVISLTGGGVRAEDTEGCKDHPLLTRMPGYSLASCSNSFNQVEVVTGLNGEERKMKTLEGQVSVMEYSYLPENEGKLPSWFQVVKNYGNALAKIGGEKIFGDPGSATFSLAKGGKETWVTLELNTSDADGVNLYSFIVKVIELEAMKQEVGANEMLEELNKSGFIALYINFETGKAEIKSDSRKIIAGIAEMLAMDTALKISIEGHTDNAGTAAANKILSENRAKSVSTALAGKGISGSRLSAKGWGQEKPIADNRSEDGRAKNRRVEIVKI